MNGSRLYDRIFEYAAGDVGLLALTGPEAVERDAASPAAAAWQLLLGAMQLARAGERSAANDWLNHAVRQRLGDDVFRAELLGESGRGLFDSGRLQDAYEILNSAMSSWREVCEQAIAASEAGDRQAAAAFVEQLMPIFAGAGIQPPADEAAIRSGGQDPRRLVLDWLIGRAAGGRAHTANTFLHLLAKAGMIDDARRIAEEELDWVAQNLTSPPRPAAALDFGQRLIDPSVRRALYQLLLARAEIELAAGEFQASADGFAAAAALYEEHVADISDVNRLLRARFNMANSLLRLQRIEEAIAIYEQCRFGFDSIGDAEAAQRVAHAIVFARTMADDDDA